MKKFYAFTLGALLFLFPFINKAQSGTDFWFAPPEVTDLHNTPGGEPIYLLVSTFGQAATVTISQPANPGFNGGVPIVVNLNANSTARINLTSFKTILETEPTNVVLNTGLRVQSTATITCYYEISNTNNTDIFALKGANGLGKEFYIPLHKHAPFFNHTFASPHEAYASFDIVATENNTVVTIYSPVQVDGHPALQQFSVTLNIGQTYSCGWTGLNYQQPSTHPSGAVVIADKPIAVSIKDDSNHNPSGGCYDLTGDQIVPVDILGTEYVAVKGQLNATGDESVIITAVQNNTQIFINGNPIPIATLFAGETYRYDMDNLFGSPAGSSVYITSSKPVYAMHITGFGCEMGQAILPPLNCAGSQQVSFVRSTAETFFLTLLVRSTSIGNFSIIGSGTAVINPASFVAVPGTGGQWMAARIQYNTVQIPVDSTFLVTNSTDVFALGIINGGAATGCRYGFFSEFASKIFVDAGPDMLVCANNVVNLNGSVVGGSTTGIWTTTGSGIFTPNNTTLNAVYTPSPADTTIGFIQFTLTSTGNCTPVSDNMMVTFTPAPVVNAGPPTIYSCAKDSVQLMGSVTGGSVTGLWSTSGTGTFFPNAAILNAKYIPSNADTAGFYTQGISPPMQAKWLSLVCGVEPGKPKPVHFDDAAVSGNSDQLPTVRPLVNQVGYDMGAPKMFTAQSNFLVDDASFELIDMQGAAVFSGKLEKRGRISGAYGSDWGSFYWSGDFTTYDAPGTYRIRANVGGVSEISWPFQIGDNQLWAVTSRPAYRFFYYQRCGMEISGFHAACHLDDAASSDGLRQFDLTGGWHDAGDYNKYYNAPYVLGLATAYSLAASLFEQQDEDENGISDFLDEIVWGAEHCQRMVAADGSVHAAITSGYGFWSAPEIETDNIPGTGDERRTQGSDTGNDPSEHAAALAKAARLTQRHDFVVTAEKALGWSLEKGQKGALQLSAAIDLFAVTDKQEYEDLAREIFEALGPADTEITRNYDRTFFEDHTEALRKRLIQEADASRRFG